MESFDIELTDKEIEWIREFFRAKGNATQAARNIYGGTPGSCRVKGHKKLKKLDPIITDILEKEFYKMEYQGINGVDFYLGDLKRRIEKDKKYDEIVKRAMKSKRAFAQLERAIREGDTLV